MAVLYETAERPIREGCFIDHQEEFRDVIFRIFYSRLSNFVDILREIREGPEWVAHCKYFTRHTRFAQHTCPTLGPPAFLLYLAASFVSHIEEPQEAHELWLYDPTMYGKFLYKAAIGYRLLGDSRTAIHVINAALHFQPGDATFLAEMRRIQVLANAQSSYDIKLEHFVYAGINLAYLLKLYKILNSSFEVVTGCRISSGIGSITGRTSGICMLHLQMFSN